MTTLEETSPKFVKGEKILEILSSRSYTNVGKLYIDYCDSEGVVVHSFLK